MKLGKLINTHGNHCFYFPEHNLITFPVKHKWFQAADILLIEKSCYELRQLVERYQITERIIMPRAGCGNGRLSWDAVKPILEQLSDQYHRNVLVEATMKVKLLTGETVSVYFRYENRPNKRGRVKRGSVILSVRTVAIIEDENHHILASGSAKCTAEDNFSRVVGRRLALERAIEAYRREFQPGQIEIDKRDLNLKLAATGMRFV